MLRRRVAGAVVLFFGLVGCGSPAPAPVMPDVVGKALDVAKSDIKHAGFKGQVEVLGGGLFGIVDEGNWLVCGQVPSAGSPIAEEPRLEVDRSCGDNTPEPTSIPTAAPEASTEPTETAPEPAETPTAEPETSRPEEPEQDTAVSAKTVEKTFKAHLRNNGIKKIGAMCDDSLTHWACFYDGVSGDSEKLRVSLTTDGGWSTTEIEDLASAAGLHWFNFIGCDYPELSVIVVVVNGLEHNVFRYDTNVDMLCD